MKGLIYSIDYPEEVVKHDYFIAAIDFLCSSSALGERLERDACSLTPLGLEREYARRRKVTIISSVIPSSPIEAAGVGGASEVQRMEIYDACAVWRYFFYCTRFRFCLGLITSYLGVIMVDFRTEPWHVR